MPTPYLIGTNTPGSAATQTVTVGAGGTGTNDVILVGLGNTSSSGATISSVTDSAGNAYARLVAPASTTN